MALVFALFHRSVGNFGWKMALIFPLYQGVYLKCARFFSYSSEFIFASSQHDEIVATYMRSLADIAGRKAELRVKARVARESLNAARSHLQLAEEAVQLIATSSAASLNYRIDMSRERALANKAVVSQEAEAAEASTQLAALDEFS